MTALQRLALWLLALALLAAPLVAVFNGWIASERWPIQRLRLEAEFAHVAEDEVREAVRPLLGGGFFAVRPDRVREALLALPWVREAEVRKRWPDRLEIRLLERRAVARWGESALLSERGVVFSPDSPQRLQALPLFLGPESRRLELFELYRLGNNEFAGLGLAVREVRLSARGSWALLLDDGSEVLLGRVEPEQRLRRYARLLPRLREEGRPIVRADLRYADGLAVRWGDPIETVPKTGVQPPRQGRT